GGGQRVRAEPVPAPEPVLGPVQSRHVLDAPRRMATRRQGAAAGRSAGRSAAGGIPGAPRRAAASGPAQGGRGGSSPPPRTPSADRFRVPLPAGELTGKRNRKAMKGGVATAAPRESGGW